MNHVTITHQCFSEIHGEGGRMKIDVDALRYRIKVHRAVREARKKKGKRVIANDAMCDACEALLDEREKLITDNDLVRERVTDWLCDKHKTVALEWPDCLWCELEKLRAK